MPTLSPGKTLRSAEPTLLVENDLPVGTYRFRLTVLDDAGNESAPAEIAVTVTERPVINLNVLRDRMVLRRVITPVPPILRQRGGGN